MEHRAHAAGARALIGAGWWGRARWWSGTLGTYALVERAGDIHSAREIQRRRCEIRTLFDVIEAY